ncbi:hypothetical protein [Flavobacterium beibuense]|uniref:hypothetical protein n=1 Tax=Flavobacterium beibuense TaxID=657326 RepID=UPI003A933572
MRTIKLTKVSRKHIEILQEEIYNYAQGFKEHLKRPENHSVYLYSIAQADIASNLWYLLRKKIESDKNVQSFSLPASEAIVLLNACANASLLSADKYVANVTEIYKNEIDQQLKSIIIPII